MVRGIASTRFGSTSIATAKTAPGEGEEYRQDRRRGRARYAVRGSPTRPRRRPPAKPSPYETARLRLLSRRRRRDLARFLLAPPAAPQATVGRRGSRRRSPARPRPAARGRGDPPVDRPKLDQAEHQEHAAGEKTDEHTNAATAFPPLTGRTRSRSSILRGPIAAVLAPRLSGGQSGTPAASIASFLTHDATPLARGRGRDVDGFPLGGVKPDGHRSVTKLAHRSALPACVARIRLTASHGFSSRSCTG